VIERVANVSLSVISDVYIKRDVPLIVTDATDDWPARRLFTLKFLQKVRTVPFPLQRRFDWQGLNSVELAYT